MKAINQRFRFLVVAMCLGILASVFILYEDVKMHQHYVDLYLAVAILTTVCLLGLLIWENRKLKTATLIIENQIMHIQPALIDVGICGKKDTSENIGGIEVFISCFGILLDSKVIKFNLDGIHLKTVEIGRQFICLTYGTGEQTHKIRILHEKISNEELENIVEKFRYETSVIPKLVEC